MSSSNRFKLIFFLSLAIVFNSACRFWGGSTTKTNPDSPVAEVQTDIPFNTKEPETFQAEIILSNYIGGNKAKRNHFIAKKGVKNLIAFDYGTENETATLQTNESDVYFIDRKQKTIRKKTGSDPADAIDDLKKFLTTKWLNEKSAGEFEDLGVVDNFLKFRVTLSDSEKTEVLIFVDKDLNIPVKQEFYSIQENKKVLTYSVEVKNLKTEVSDEIFALPVGYSEGTVLD